MRTRLGGSGCLIRDHRPVTGWDRPTFAKFLPDFEFPPYGLIELAHNYGNKLSTWFVPPETADYVFFVSSADASNLYLSTDASPANKKLIAQETIESPQRTWLRGACGWQRTPTQRQ